MVCPPRWDDISPNIVSNGDLGEVRVSNETCNHPDVDVQADVPSQLSQEERTWD